MKCNFGIDRLKGKVDPPGDKSISHRALILACLAKGTSEIVNLANGQDVLHTQKAIVQLGAKQVSNPDLNSLKITGANLTTPKKTIFVGNSGTGIRLLAGVCAGQDFESRLDGDKSIRSRPMDRIIDPLVEMGASIKSNEKYSPLTIKGGNLSGINYEMVVPSAQVKSTILLAGLFASGQTTVNEKVQTRIHTEEMLKQFGANIDKPNPLITTIKKSELLAQKIIVPTDPSAAAFWVVAACILDGSSIEIPNVYLGPARGGYIEVLKRMGADISLTPTNNGDNLYHIEVKSTELSATDITAEEIPSLIDEIPILCIAAACAQGETKFFGAGELRFKESNRIKSLKNAFDILGGDCTIQDDTILIKNTNGFSGGKIEAAGDHRIAMAFAIASLRASKIIHIIGFKKAIKTSYPNFLNDLKCLTSIH